MWIYYVFLFLLNFVNCSSLSKSSTTHYIQRLHIHIIILDILLWNYILKQFWTSRLIVFSTFFPLLVFWKLVSFIINIPQQNQRLSNSFGEAKRFASFALRRAQQRYQRHLNLEYPGINKAGNYGWHCLTWPSLLNQPPWKTSRESQDKDQLSNCNRPRGESIGK